MRLPVRSRSGNIVLAFIGSLYAVSAFSILAWFVFEAWSAANMSDRVLQLALAGAAACGIWLAFSALKNLSLTQHPQRSWRSHKVSP
ncbi:MAG: hypothetical protein M3P06_22975 [Acidobacteriota bacterium]|nr:hypothetical protein [Acidobacteriota bacterium]